MFFFRILAVLAVMWTENDGMLLWEAPLQPPWGEVLIGIIQNQWLIPFFFLAGSSCSSRAHVGVKGLVFWVEYIKALKVFGKIFLITLMRFFGPKCCL